jgi:hypothetical protein
MITSKDRLKQFIEYQHITTNQFCKKNLLSNSFFNNISSIGSDKLSNIFNNYPDLNMDWVITGRGQMLYKEPENAAEWKEKYYQLLDMKFTIVAPDNEALKKNADVVTIGHNDELTVAAEDEVKLNKPSKT